MTANAPDIFARHLQPGERLIWNIAASPDLVRADISRQRERNTIVLAITGPIALLLAISFANAVTPKPPVTSFTLFPNLDFDPFLAPLYIIGALVLGAVAIFAAFRLIMPQWPLAFDFAVTNTRLLALGPDGRIAAELDGSRISGITIREDDRRPSVIVHPCSIDPGQDFTLAFILAPRETKAVIEETFLKQEPEAKS